MSKPADIEKIRTTLIAVGLNPELVDLPWLARVKADAEERIAAAHGEADFSDSEPFFSAAREHDGS